MSEGAPDRSRRLTDAIPDPQFVRDCLSQALREAGVLRELLRVAERAERVRSQRVPAAGKAVTRE